MTESNKELKKRILRKSRFTLTYRILRIMLIVFLLYCVYVFSINFIDQKLNVANEHAYYSKLAIEWTIPNVRGDFNFEEEEMTMFGTKKLSYNLIKKVGNDDKVIGEANVTKRLKNPSFISFSHPGKQQLNEFSFSLPIDPRNGKKLDGNAWPNVWDTLSMLPEGTVGEMAFSTNSFMESKQLIDLLDKYDLHVLWMPLYTSEFVNYEPYWSSSSNKSLMVPHFGLSGGNDRNEYFHESSVITRLTQDTLRESEQLMLKNMEELLTKSSSYYEQFLGLGHFEQKYQYLKENGFTVYGAVVTGPVKELLKLQDASFIQGEQLGEVELWNWQSN
ncbi:anti-sigma factor [Sporosarcina koreensis]|uniref:anti-sigma factor n=1 Tax=Sporosarcina koreensis TaxID=334735 RepID=UPI000758F184|nr:anti-sigma factor [Sporosarcina koreensis]